MNFHKYFALFYFIYLSHLMTLVIIASASTISSTVKPIIVQSRIIGGVNALPNEFPFHLALVQDGNTACGASLLTKDYVLTAAHCTEGYSAQYLEIIAGEHILSKTEGQEQTRNIAAIIKHPDYNESSMLHDIALLKLSAPVKLNKKIQPVKLPESNYVAKDTATVTGWGVTDEEDVINSDRLQKIDLPIADHTQCAKNYFELNSEKPVLDMQICIGYLDRSGKDACRGDSGGPAVVKNGKEFIQIGITSFGAGCAREGYPGVYTQVAKYRGWIDSHVTS